jgi:hypothetical protein
LSLDVPEERSIARCGAFFVDAVLAGTTTVLAGGVLLSFLLMSVGWLLFGTASLRAGILPAPFPTCGSSEAAIQRDSYPRRRVRLP